jgi:hypothetical protein
MVCHDAGVRPVTSKPGQPGRGGWQSASDETATENNETLNNEKMIHITNPQDIAAAESDTNQHQTTNEPI